MLYLLCCLYFGTSVPLLLQKLPLVVAPKNIILSRASMLPFSISPLTSLFRSLLKWQFLQEVSQPLQVGGQYLLFCDHMAMPQYIFPSHNLSQNIALFCPLLNCKFHEGYNCASCLTLHLNN